MTRINKYQLYAGYTEISLPKGAQVISVGAQITSTFSQNRSLHIWVLVDSEEREQELRGFYTALTNNIIDRPNPLQYLGMAMAIVNSSTGSLIEIEYHIFEELIER